MTPERYIQFITGAEKMQFSKYRVSCHEKKPAEAGRDSLTDNGLWCYRVQISGVVGVSLGDIAILRDIHDSMCGQAALAAKGNDVACLLAAQGNNSSGIPEDGGIIPAGEMFHDNYI